MDLIATTELMAVNTMLRAIGESPINSLDNTGMVDAVLAQQTLETISRTVQERGWYWNTQENLLLVRTYPDNHLVLPDNCLKVDTVGQDGLYYPVIQRGPRLFNKRTNSFVFDKDLTVDLVEFLPFNEMPQAARTFVAMSAVRKFQEDRVGSETLAKMHSEDEKVAWNALVNAEAETQDANIFDSYDVRRVLGDR
jgi:hypothetical protein